MASMVEICNLALSKAGITDSIMNLDTEQSVPALWCKANFAPARDEVLRDFPWNFATKNVVLSALDYDHPDGKKVYLYPSDCLNVLDVSKTLFEIGVIGEGTNMRKVIITGADNAQIKYIARVSDPNIFDPIFISALAWYLAGELSLSVGGNNTGRSQAAFQQYELTKSKAQRASVSESKTDAYKNNEFVSTRA